MGEPALRPIQIPTVQETTRPTRLTPRRVERVPIEPEPSRRTSRWLLALLAAVALIAAGWFLANALDDDEPTEIVPTRPTTPPAPDNPIFEPIDDAESVVDEINDNALEDELLDELDLDPPTGPIPAGYRFTTVDTDGMALTIQVDTTTGNFSIESADGFGARSIDGRLVARSTPSDEWTPVDDAEVESIQRFGLTQLVSERDVITPEIEPWVSVVSSDEIDGQTTTLYRIDVASLNAEQPDLLSAWSAPFGLDAGTLVTATSEPMTILVQSQAEGVVRSFTITPPGTERTIQYRLDELYEDPPAISL